MSPLFRRSLSRALAPLLAALLCGSPARADDDPMAPYRARFKAGMDRYTAGDLPKAIDAWEAIYGELGPDKAYRVAFDLGRAYDREGDSPHAAERFAAFLDAVTQRRAAANAIEPVVAKEESEARMRLDQLNAQLGRLKVEAGTPAQAKARIDSAPPRPLPFTAYVTPGDHAVSFTSDDGTERSVKVTVPAGSVLAVPSPPAPPPPIPIPIPIPAPIPAPAPAPAQLPPPPLHTTDHPFSPMLLFVAGGATGVAAAVTTVWYAQALSTKSSYDAASNDPARQSSLRDVYDGQRPTAYVALGTTIGLAAVTGALATWYVAGARDVTVTPTLVATPNGAGAGLVGRF